MNNQNGGTIQKQTTTKTTNDQILEAARQQAIFTKSPSQMQRYGGGAGDNQRLMSPYDEKNGGAKKTA